MKISKPHFWYNKSQRNGVFILFVIILILQFLIVFIDFSSDDIPVYSLSETKKIQRQIDSLKEIQKTSSKPLLYPFNPNFISDYKGAILGMSVEEIDRLFEFRKKNKYVNSAKEFQQVTKISDSLLAIISPYFKFPDWVQENSNKKKNTFTSKSPIKLSTNDLNLATANDFKSINGIGEKISQRIINYRKKLQGFTYTSQLYEVWNLDSLLVDKILAKFQIYSKPSIKKLNINTATFKQVLAIPYIDYELCKKIFNYRDEVAELQKIEELKNIVDFPNEKYERIVLYLAAK